LKQERLIIWVSDFSDNTGEGILANNFIRLLLNKYKSHKIEIKTFDRTFTNVNNKFKNNKMFKKNFIHKYIEPFYGVWYLWKNYNNKIVYVNYLPLWNFILLFLLPKKTILGPITGGVYDDKVKNFNFFIRKYILNFFYKISLSFIYKKFNNIIFSTYLLKKYVDKKYYKKTIFNFALLAIKKENISYEKKKYDIIFYNREHPTKKTNNLKNIIYHLSSKFKICVVGDYFNKRNNITNYGFVNRKKIYQLLKQSHITLSGSENLMSFFNIDSLNNNNFIFYEKISGQEWINKSRYFVFCDYTLPADVESKVIHYIKKKSINDVNFKKFIKKNNKKIINFINSY